MSAQPPTPLILATPQYETIRDAKDGGVIPGDSLRAPLAPASGAIDVAPGSPVVVVAQRLLDSPTVKKLLLAVKLAWGAFSAYVLVAVLFAGGPFALDSAAWIALLKDASYPALVTIAGVYGITLKASDNNPVVNGSLKKAGA